MRTPTLFASLKTLALIALVTALTSCVDDKPPQSSSGDSEGDGVDCGDVVCKPPQVCREDPDGGTPVCVTADSDNADPGPLTEECKAIPEGLEVPIGLAGEQPLHWVEGGCVTVSYDDASLRLTLQEVVEAWEAIDCVTLCLLGPEQADAPPDPNLGERRIHFTLDAPEPPVLVLTEQTFSLSTGQIASAVVRVAPEQASHTASLLRALAQAVGLGEPEDGTPSVLERQLGPDAPETDFFEADRETICVLYGDPPLCEVSR